MMIETIIIPLDTSPEAESVLPVAYDVARRHNAKVLLVSVLEVPHEFAAWVDAHRRSEQWNQNRLNRDHYLNEIAKRAPDLHVETTTLAGNPTSTITRLANDTANPMIVMGSHGRSGWKRLTVGSVTFGVVQAVTCPVIVVGVRADAAAITKPLLTRILAPLDGSEFSEAALEQLVETNVVPEEVHLLRVVETAGWYGAAHATLDIYGVDEYRRIVTEAAEKYLRGVAERLEALGSKVTYEVREGLPSSQITMVASEWQPSMVAMATHGRGGISRVILGSVAEHVLRELDCPLMLVRPSEIADSN